MVSENIKEINPATSRKEITSLDELKTLELEIMKRVHTFCVERKITYFLAFGTLIGAVRHKGFIP